MDEPAVAAARPRATGRGLQQDDVRRPFPLLQRKGGPQAGETATDDAHVGGDIALERRRRVVRPRLVPPPRWETRYDAQAVAADRCRRIWKRTFPTIRVTATMKMTLPITFTCGGAPTRAAPQTKSGNVIFGPLLK